MSDAVLPTERIQAELNKRYPTLIVLSNELYEAYVEQVGEAGIATVTESGPTYQYKGIRVVSESSEEASGNPDSVIVEIDL